MTPLRSLRRISSCKNAIERVAADDHVATAGSSAEVDNEEKPVVQQKHDSDCDWSVRS